MKKLSKICKIVLEYTLKWSQLISSSDNNVIETTRKSCRQPEMSGWIQAAMQQNTIFED